MMRGSSFSPARAPRRIFFGFRIFVFRRECLAIVLSCVTLGFKMF